VQTAEPIDLPSGLWTQVGWRKHSSIIFSRWHQCAHRRGHIGAIWPIWFNHPYAVAMRSHVKLLWPLVIIITINTFTVVLYANALNKSTYLLFTFIGCALENNRHNSYKYSSE